MTSAPRRGRFLPAAQAAGVAETGHAVVAVRPLAARGHAQGSTGPQKRSFSQMGSSRRGGAPHPVGRGQLLAAVGRVGAAWVEPEHPDNRPSTFARPPGLRSRLRRADRERPSAGRRAAGHDTSTIAFSPATGGPGLVSATGPGLNPSPCGQGWGTCVQKRSALRCGRRVGPRGLDHRRPGPRAGGGDRRPTGCRGLHSGALADAIVASAIGSTSSSVSSCEGDSQLAPRNRLNASGTTSLTARS
jgi:hypothetical protein